MPEGNETYPEYLTDRNVLRCPSSVLLGGEPEPFNSADGITDETYFYLGWAIATEEEGLAFLDAYESLDPDTYNNDIPIDPSRSSMGHKMLYRLRKGIDRFFIKDINVAGEWPAARMPVMWERPGHHDPDGGNVLFMDGHVEFIRYPGKFPMTEAFIERCGRPR